MIKQIVDCLEKMEGRYSYRLIFQDWVAITALSIQNCCKLMHDKIWNEREQLFKSIMGKYTLEERKNFCKMTAMLSDEFEQGDIHDILGEIYMSQRSGNSKLGQFFTPFHISELCARVAIETQMIDYNEQVIRINEPSAGAGGMIIAAIKILQEKGIDYQNKIEIVAQDLDWNGVYMTYVQLSLLGVKATVIQGNTLTEQCVEGKIPENRVFYTPAKMGVLI